MTLTKQDIREQAKKYRRSIRPNIDDAEKACALFFENCAPQKDQIIALYWPMKDEFSTQLILEKLLEFSEDFSSFFFKLILQNYFG